MLTIRLTRKGKKNQPFFRVVIIDKRRSSKGGRTVEDLGYVDPLKKRKSFKKERIQYWLSKGAKPSATIHNLLVSEKIIDAKKIHVSRLSKKAQAKVTEAKKTAPQNDSEAVIAGQVTPAEAEKPAEPAQNSSDNEADKEEKSVEEVPVELPPAETPTEIEAPKEPASGETTREKTEA